MQVNLTMNDPGAAAQPSPANGRGKGKGRAAAKAPANKAAVKKPANGRRGRYKTYDVAKAQAALERQKELKATYASVVGALVPALADLADRTLDTMATDPHAHESVDAFHSVQTFLDTRMDDVIATAQRRHEFDMQTAATDREILQEISNKSFHVSPQTPAARPM